MFSLKLLRTPLLALGTAAALAFAGPPGAATAAAPTAAAPTVTTQVTVYKLTQSQAASQLSAAGVTWSSSGGCTTRSRSTTPRSRA